MAKHSGAAPTAAIGAHIGLHLICCTAPMCASCLCTSLQSWQALSSVESKQIIHNLIEPCSKPTASKCSFPKCGQNAKAAMGTTGAPILLAGSKWCVHAKDQVSSLSFLVMFHNLTNPSLNAVASVLDVDDQLKSQMMRLCAGNLVPANKKS